MTLREHIFNRIEMGDRHLNGAVYDFLVSEGYAVMINESSTHFHFLRSDGCISWSHENVFEVIRQAKEDSGNPSMKYICN